MPDAIRFSARAAWRVRRHCGKEVLREWDDSIFTEKFCNRHKHERKGWGEASLGQYRAFPATRVGDASWARFR
jgi:hypothetical protein